MKTELLRGFARLQTELEQNTRLRWSVLIIMLLAAVWLSLVLSDLNRDIRLDRLQYVDIVHDLGDMEAEQVWQERLSQVIKEGSDLRRRLWSARSDSLLVAEFQTELRRIAADTGVRVINVQVGSAQPLAALPNGKSIRARIQGRFENNEVLDLLQAIESSPWMMVTEQIEINYRAKPDRVDIRLRTWGITEP